MLVRAALFDDYSLRLNYGWMCVDRIKTDGCAEPKEFYSICLMTVRISESQRSILCAYPCEEHLNGNYTICEQFDYYYLFLIRCAQFASVKHRINRKWTVKHLREQMCVFFFWRFRINKNKCRYLILGEKENIYTSFVFFCVLRGPKQIHYTPLINWPK